MESALEARKKWNIDEVIKKVTLAVYRYDGLDKYEVRDGWYSLKAYIGTLEIELESYKRKEKDGLRIQSK